MPLMSLRWPIVIAVAGGALFVGGFLVIVWLSGGLRTEGPYLDWNAVAALATALAAAVALVAVGAIGATLEEVNASRRAERQSLMPYLRVDVGIEGQEQWQPSFVPTHSGHIFTAEDFGEHVDTEGLKALQPAEGQDAHTVCIWVTNKQSAPLGHAYRIRVGLLFAWRSGDGEWGLSSAEVNFAYVEAGKSTAVRLTQVRKDVSELVVEVLSVSYYGMYLDRELRNRHGALTLYYNPAGRGLINDRRYGLGEADQEG